MKQRQFLIISFVFLKFFGKSNVLKNLINSLNFNLVCYPDSIDVLVGSSCQCTCTSSGSGGGGGPGGRSIDLINTFMHLIFFGFILFYSFNHGWIGKLHKTCDELGGSCVVPDSCRGQSYETAPCDGNLLCCGLGPPGGGRPINLRNNFIDLIFFRLYYY